MKHRIALRVPDVTDAYAIAAEANDLRVVRTLRDYFPHPYSVSDALDYIDRVGEQAAPRTHFVITVDGEVAGVTGLFVGEDVMRLNAEVGYWLGHRWWGRGIATAATRLLVDLAWRELEVERVFAEVFSNNSGSLRMLAKCGFVEEYRLPGVILKDGARLGLVAMGIRKPGSRMALDDVGEN